MNPPIVYLDQNHWITLAQSLHAREKARSSELPAADQLVNLARRGEVILPISASHFAETGHVARADRRESLAETMIQLSEGWVMTCVLAIRKTELRRGFMSLSPVLDTGEIFGRRPSMLFRSTALESHEKSLVPAIAHEIDEADRPLYHQALTAGIVPTADAELASATAQRWARQLQDLGEYIRDNPAQRDLRLVAALMTFQDLKDEIAYEYLMAGGPIDGLEEFMGEDRIVSFFSTMPMVSRTMSLFEQRTRNPQREWEINDLQDVFSLSAAAAYADIVIGEKNAAHFLKNAARQCPAGAEVCSKIRDAVARLDGDGD